MIVQLVTVLLIAAAVAVLWRSGQIPEGRQGLWFAVGGAVFVLVSTLFGLMMGIPPADSLTLRDWSWGSLPPLCVGYALILTGFIGAIRALRGRTGTRD